MVVCDVNHVIGIDCPKGGETVTDDGEEGDHDVVDDVNDIVLLCT